MFIKNKTIFLLIIITIFISCDNREIKYSGMNDLVVGIQVVRLYDNGDFYLELGAGGNKGKYVIQNDTVLLNYNNKAENWPDKLIITEKYFETIENKYHKRTVKIYRNN